MNAASQESQILEYLQSGGALTPIEALNLFGCFRLGARIWNLRKAGHPIDDELVHEGRKKFSRYFWANKKAERDETHLGLLDNKAQTHR